MKSKKNPALSYVTLIHQINLESTGFFFVCNKNRSVDFYASLGRDITYYGTEFYNFVTKKISNGWYYCKERTQLIGTSLYGEYCMYYVLMKCTGMK